MSFCFSRFSLASNLHIFFYLVFGASLIAPLSSYAQLSTSPASAVTEIPRSHWYYRWGDSPRDDQGMPLWVYEEISSPEWKPMEGGSHVLANRQKYHFLWYRIQLPEGYWQHPALLLPPVSQNVEVYQHHQRIYHFGELKPSNSNKYWLVRWHFIPLESTDAKNNTLFLRIYSATQDIGIQRDKVWLGPQAEVIKVAIKLDLESFVLGSFFTFAGLFSIFVYFRRRKQQLYFILSFGAFATCIGISQLSGGAISQLFIEATSVWYYVVTNTFLLWPIGLYIFIEQILGRGYKSLIRRIWQVHVLFAVVVFLLDIANVSPMPSAIPWFLGLLMVGIFILIPITAKMAFKGNFEAKILSAGMLILMLSGLHDILASFAVIPSWRMLFLWGVFVFILFLAYILEYRFAQAHRQLEEYSQTLEQKVEQRTQELSEKNEALAQTLGELRATQHQLIMQEKMASLGNLVAGVAHEMNNPIGAIHSAADVATRGIRKIRSLLPQNREPDQPNHDEGQLQRSLNLLEGNSKVITTASDRVAKIVQSLRAFARLDEAVFQKTDLHDNIDATLTLLQHKLRDKAEVIKEYGDIPPIHCYPSELNQVWMNLFQNAVQAIEHKGTIKIATGADETHVYVRISDTGKGIPPEELQNIFDPGFTTQGGGVGVGLGLSIVYNIIQKHHGDINVSSTVGSGTEFIIALPIEQT